MGNPISNDMRIVQALLLFASTIQCVAEMDTRTCYDANNKPLPSHRPCVSTSTQSISHCCSLADMCIGDTLCLSQWGTLYVGGCTVKDWTGNSGKGMCPKYCGKIGADIRVCDNSDSGWNFCCNATLSYEICCQNTFKISGNATSQIVVQRPWEVAQAANTLPSTSSSPLPSSTSTFPTSPPSQCPAPTASRSSKVPEIALGLGLGIPLLVALGFLFRENRRKKIAEAQLYRQDSATRSLRSAIGHEIRPTNSNMVELSQSNQVHEMAYEGRYREPR